MIAVMVVIKYPDEKKEEYGLVTWKKYPKIGDKRFLYSAEWFKVIEIIDNYNVIMTPMED